MAWNDLTFVDCSLLTAAKMTQLQGNFAALAAGEPGAPPLRIVGVSSLATVHASSGLLAPQVSSLGLLHVSSGFVGPHTSSFGTVHAGSGFVGPQVGSFGTVHVGSGIVAPGVNSLGQIFSPRWAITHVLSNASNLPASGSFQTRGGQAWALVSGSLYSATGAHLGGFNLRIDGTKKYECRFFINAALEHHAVAPVMVPLGIASGSHVLHLDVACGTTDENDFFHAVVLELPF